MPEPITTELPKPERLTVGETPVYLKSPLEVNGQQITQLTLQAERSRGKDGLESAVLLLKEQSRRRGEEGQSFAKPLPNVNDMEEVDWEKVGGIQYTMPDGTVHTIPKDQLSLVKPEEAAPEPSPISFTPRSLDEGGPIPHEEPTLARKILETYSGTPTTLTIVGLKAYETRAYDLADKAMQLKTSLGERIWKQGFGPVYFHEKLRQHYLDMLKASNSPFAEQSIKIAEAAGYNRYQDILKNKNFLTRGSRRLIEWMKDNLGMRTLVQKFALEEIAHMRESGQIKEREAFEREGASIRKRFEIDVDNQDEYIRKTLGEDIDLLDPAKHPEHKPLVDEVKNLVRRYATGEITTKVDFDKETDTLFQTHLKGGRPDLFAQAELYTSSLYEVAENLRAKAGHEGGLAAIDAQLENMQVRLGMGVMGEATALEPTDVQRGTEMVRSTLTTLEKKGITLLVNEATVSSGVAIALSLVVLPKMAVSGFARTVGGFAGGMAAGAIFGGVREYRQLEREYLTHLREREAGLTFAPDAKRRAWMERFFVGQRSADELMTSIRSPLYNPDGKTVRDAISDEELRSVMANLADAKARKALSGREHERNAQRVGLIQFSGRENIETQRTALDLTVAQAEKDLAAYVADHLHPAELGRSGADLPNLADLTAAQTRILAEGVNRVEGLSDPIKVTLGLLDKYNPEVEMLRRRFPLLGPEVTTGKAQGLEDILKEFRRAARGAAVKKGLVVGATGALIGLGIRGVMEGGSEMLSRVLTKTPDLGPLADADVGPGQHFQFSQNLQLANGNLVDPQGHTVIDNFSAELAKHANFIRNDGQLTDAGKQWILDQAHASGYNLEIPQAVTSTVTSADVPPLPGQPVPGIAAYTDTSGGLHAVESIIPQGTRLVEGPAVGGGGEHVYKLVDASDNHALLTDIRMDAQGHIANIDALNRSPEAVAHGIELTSPAHETFTAVEAGGVGGTFEKSVSDMGTEHGNRGPWGWLEEPIGGDPSISHDIPATNLTKNLFRGTFENYYRAQDHVTGAFQWDTASHAVGEKVDYTRMGGDTLFHDVPTALFANEQIVKLGHIMDQAIDLKEVHLVDFSHDFAGLTPAEQAILTSERVDEKTYEVLRAAYAIGRVGRVATKDEVQMFLDYMGGEKSVTLLQPTITMSGVSSTLFTNIITLPEAPPTPDFGWVPPIPIISRRPLEQGSEWSGVPFAIPPREIEPSLYYGGETLQSLREWLKKNPDLVQTYRRVQNPDGSTSWVDKNGDIVTRDVRKEQAAVQTYLDWIKSNNPDHYVLLESLAKEQTMRPMLAESRVSINIPARMEGKNIYRLLERYVQQKDKDGNPLDPNLFEINILVNRRQGEQPDNTVDEINRFIRDSQAKGETHRINYLDVQFDPATANVGHARQVITDLTLMRSLQRPDQSAPLYIESEDADLMDVDQKTVTNIINTLDNQPYWDAVRGIQDREPEILMKNDYLFVQRRLWDFTELLLRRQGLRPENNPKWHHTWNRVITGGWNTAYSAQAYALIHGYDPKQTKGEDMTVGEKMTMIRGDGMNPNLDVIGRVYTRSSSSPRRYVYEILSGKGAYSEAFEDEDLNRTLKTASLDELIKRIEPVSRISENNTDYFGSLMRGHYKAIRELIPDELTAKKTYDMLMTFTGFKKEDYAYTPDGSVEIHSFANLKTALEDYRARHQTPRKPGERTKYQTTADEPLPPTDTAESVVLQPTAPIPPEEASEEVATASPTSPTPPPPPTT